MMPRDRAKKVCKRVTDQVKAVMAQILEDSALAAAIGIARQALADPAMRPEVTCFFDEATCSASYVAHDPATRCAAIIDPVLDYDSATGEIAYSSADGVVAHIADLGLSAEWLLETHVHADHLSAADYLQDRLGGQRAIGRGVVAVQKAFADILEPGTDFSCDGSQFDRLLDDGDRMALGNLSVQALAMPGHTPSDMAFAIGDAVFAGDTIFMPDYGTARADFPGGDAAQLFRSIRRLLSLPAACRLFVGHDYKAPGRDAFAWETRIGLQHESNVHVRVGTEEGDFVALRTMRDRGLDAPRLMLPSVRANMGGGRLPVTGTATKRQSGVAARRR